MTNYKDYKGFLIDLDGTIFRGNTPVEGAKEAVSKLRLLRRRLVFLSNRGNISRDMCVRKLARAGIGVKKEEIILSSYIAATFIKTHYKNSKLWVLGEQGLVDELLEANLKFAEQPEGADWLVVTLHEKLTYEDLNQAFRAVKAGARIIATNADKSFPRDDGESIDVGGMLGAIEATTNHRADIIVGKPSHIMINEALSQLRLPAEQCVVIGDSLGSDIILGKLYGFKTLLVLSGSTQRGDLIHSSIKPDDVMDSIALLAAK